MKNTDIIRLLSLFFLLIASTAVKAQHFNVLFLGNSYTSVNDLPGTISGLLADSGKTMTYASNTPGGHCFFQHVENTVSLGLIRQGGWDFVVLQEQSQLPSIDFYRYSTMYPAATRLRDTIMRYNPCAQVVFYMTWGWRDGGQQCEDYGQGLYCSADFTDFDHMQDTMTRAYCEIAERLQSRVAPAGEAWRTARHESGCELFGADGNHPSMLGTYLTACTFYATLWDESPMALPHPASISDDEAQQLQNAAHQTVFESPLTWNFNPPLSAGFKYRTLDQRHFFFTNTTESTFPLSFCWDFGDGYQSGEENPTHEYAESGHYLVQLKASGCNQADSTQQTVEAVVPTMVDDHTAGFAVFPNPAHGQVTVSGRGHLTLCNLWGQVIIDMETDGNTVINLERGIYVATLSNSSRSHKEKIVVE